MSEREEIRWKFQVMIENVNAAITTLENERKTIAERLEKVQRELEKQRNYWLAAMGFIITILTPLVATNYLNQSFAFVIIAATLVGIIIWVWSNLKLSKIVENYLEIDNTYLVAIKSRLLPLKGVVSTLALIENYSKKDSEDVIMYISIYANAMSYTLTNYMSQKIIDVKLDHGSFRRYYELAKVSIDRLKKTEFTTGTAPIEQFIKEFEKNEKKKDAMRSDMVQRPKMV